MDMDPPAGVHVDAVSVLGIVGIVDIHIPDCQIFTEIGMEVPGCRVLQMHALYQDFSAVPEAYHDRSVEVIEGGRLFKILLLAFSISGEDLSLIPSIINRPGRTQTPTSLLSITWPERPRSSCHWRSVIFHCLTGRQRWPFPLMVPRPVIAIFSA